MSEDKIPIIEGGDAQVVRNSKAEESSSIEGFYEVVCYDPFGVEKWKDYIPNTVATVGKNQVLNSSLDSANSPYTVTGPFMGLISGLVAPTISAADTMSSHAGWIESGGTAQPTYTSPRKTCAWTAASGGAMHLSSALVFAMTGTGTVAGCFLTFGTGAVSTIDNTSGVLFSAGQFVGGNKIVASGDSLNVSYTVSM